MWGLVGFVCVVLVDDGFVIFVVGFGLFSVLWFGLLCWWVFVGFGYLLFGVLELVGCFWRFGFGLVLNDLLFGLVCFLL